jgi:hypothetical protein
MCLIPLTLISNNFLRDAGEDSHPINFSWVENSNDLISNYSGDVLHIHLDEDQGIFVKVNKSQERHIRWYLLTPNIYSHFCGDTFTYSQFAIQKQSR